MPVIKRIPLGLLRPGMFVSRIDLSWFRHPYLSSRVGLLEDDKAVARLKALDIATVDIDLERGLDVESPVPPEPLPPDPETECPLNFPDAVPPPSDPARTMRFAKKLFSQALDCTKTVLGAAEDGGPVELDQAKLLIARLIASVKANESVLRLLSVLKDYDEYTYTHCLNVASMGVLFANHMGLPDSQLELLGLSGLLHDVGKCLLPWEVVNKPGKLTPAEFELVKRHTVLGWEYIKNQPGIPGPVAVGALEHHERLDGSGYPNRLSGSGVAGVARILSVLDVYDALTSDRVYRNRISPHLALKTIYEQRGVCFPESILDQFVKCVGVYPTSSVVQLRNGCYAVVVGNDPQRPLNPYMIVFRGPDGRRVRPKRVETLRLGLESTASGYEIARHVEPSEVPPPDLATLL